MHSSKSSHETLSDSTTVLPQSYAFISISFKCHQAYKKSDSINILCKVCFSGFGYMICEILFLLAKRATIYDVPLHYHMNFSQVDKSFYQMALSLQNLCSIHEQFLQFFQNISNKHLLVCTLILVRDFFQDRNQNMLATLN